MKVTVFGAHGMAGHVMIRYLAQQGHEITAITRDMVDVENPQNIQRFFEHLDADFVINCVGLLVRDCNQRPDRAALINSWWPHYLEQKLRDTDTRLIHLSTDCVFDGTRGDYHEKDLHTEMNVYGRSKSLGEIDNAKDITFRMSIIGPELKESGTGLFNWVHRNQDEQLPGWTNAWWNGITTLELARCIDLYMKDPKISGIYHLVSNNNRINKYDLVSLINHTFGFGKTVTPVQGPKNIDKVLLDTRQEFDFAIPDYATQLQQLKGFYPLSHVSPLSS